MIPLRTSPVSSALGALALGLGLVGCVSASPPPLGPPPPRTAAKAAPSPEEDAMRALAAGHYDEVAALDSAREVQLRLLGARAHVARGRWDEAYDVLRATSEAEVGTLVRLEALLERGRLERAFGRRAEAEATWSSLLELERRGELGRLAPAERAEALRFVGEAAHELGSAADANDAFDEAEALGPASVELLLARGRLYLDKYDEAHASEVVSEALEREPTHAEALVLHARVRLAGGLDFAAARAAAERALVSNPASTGARAILAGLSLRDLDFDGTERQLAAGLSVNPRDLELLSLRAAARFLAEDAEGFERQVDEVQRLSPGYARLFSLVADFAEWEHRYEDIERLLRRAIRLDRRDGRARGELGLTLVRAGSDAAGVVELREAFRLDPYDVRVLNTLELYERRIPRDYVEERHGPFLVRYPRHEHALLSRYVPGLLDAAHASLVARYEYTPRAPLGIEIYASQAEFAVRTTGLPEAGLAGVCFGRKLATVSPSGQKANLGMTLWHELAHVFHIGLSSSRVPRWLTEGLAERETMLTGRGWQRELDQDLYRALREDSLPRLATMNQAFTHARSLQEIGTAYHASRRLGDFLEETRGRPTLLAVLRELGRKRRADEVLPETLGPLADVDRDFRAWLAQDLARFERGFVSRRVGLPPAELAQAAARPGASELERLDFALALLEVGRADRAQPWLEPLVGGRYGADASFALARARWMLGAHDEACRRWEEQSRLLDGPELALGLARCAARSGSWSGVERHARRAAELDPTELEAWMLLAAAGHEQGDRALELRALEAWAELAEHDGVIHRRLLASLLEAGETARALREAERALWAGLGTFETHRLVAEALGRAGERGRARFELESARLLITDDASRRAWDQTARALGVTR